MMWTDNPERDADMRDFEEERWYNSRPRCARCGEHITEDYGYTDESELICSDCYFSLEDEEAEEYRKEWMYE